LKTPPVLNANQEQAIQLLKKDGFPEDAARKIVKALPSKMTAEKIRRSAIAIIAVASKKKR
jgi:hypothetical protein